MSTLKEGVVLKYQNFKNIVRIFFVLGIISAVSLAIYYFNNGWISIFYSSLLAVFPDKVKAFYDWVLEQLYNGQVRVTCTYYFRIMYANYYLLIDEHNENLYRPVGGVYKYHQDFDVSSEFDGTYDGILEPIDDTAHDLRLIISSRKTKKFFQWFESETSRETIRNLTREFREELITTGILPSEAFIGKKLIYSYIGSHREGSRNSLLNIKQIQNYDVVSVQLSETQENAIRKLTKTTPDKDKPSYIFATQEEIIQGYCNRDMGLRNISKTSKYILIGGSSSLGKRDALKGTYTQIIEDTAPMLQQNE